MFINKTEINILIFLFYLRTYSFKENIYKTNHNRWKNIKGNESCNRYKKGKQETQKSR
jgi:hypothetical protein